jgi:CRISPR-associated endonuclease Cas2
MLYLVTYDVQNNSLRTKIAKLLIKSGLERIQYSVFMGDLTEAHKRMTLEKVELLVKEAADFSILFIPLHKDMLFDITEISEHTLDWEYLTGEKICMTF